LALSTLVIPLVVGTTLAPADAQDHPGLRPAKVVCTTLSGNDASSTNPPTISGCNRPNVTGGSGTFPPGGLDASGTTSVTWRAGGRTFIQYSSTVPQSRGDKCGPDPTKPGDQRTEAILHGTVQPQGSGGVHGALRAKICVTSTLDMSLLPGQSFKL
jgi:hypothetical protein